MSIFSATANGAKTLKHSGSYLMDLFSKIGSSRQNLEGVKEMFSNAFLSNKELATAILLYSRDVRNGLGERAVFKTILSDLITFDTELATKVITLIPALGRFSDLEVAFGTPLQDHACKVWADELKKENALAFKWLYRECKVMRSFLGFANEASFRKFISKGRKGTIVESKMCDKEWAGIEYGKLPSIAGYRYSKAFKRNDKERYETFMNSKETKVNASVVYPYEIFKLWNKDKSDSAAASKYWNNMPQLKIEKNIIVVADVSGSMSSATATEGTTCMDVSVSLGTYIAQQIQGHFNRKLITFSENPTICTIPKSDDIGKVFSFVERMEWGGTTNIQATYAAILKEAKKFEVPQKDMPEFILILSDMQFNPTGSDRMFDDVKNKFKEAGYKAPVVIFWNLNSGYSGSPVTSTEKNVVLVSGFGVAALKAILACDIEKITPDGVMMEAIAPYVEMLNKIEI
jgi:hypothetical protein